jgi:hypothetical protein
LKTFFSIYIFLFFSFYNTLYAQESLRNDASTSAIKVYKTQYRTTNTSSFKKKSAYKKPIPLPFFDEFIQQKNYPLSVQDINPNDSLWINSGTLVNNSYPINSPSFGCVTFDGLADSGKVYTYVPFAFGGADSLTSQRINLINLTANDSVYFSFFYQPEGKGDYPDVGDSLVLEFKTKHNVWIKIWGVDGFTSDPLPTSFTYVILPISDTTYFDSTFQFRFRNIATLSGNNDHWNIDYIKLNKLRTYNDVTSDFAYSNIPTSPLKNYFSMPFKQFKANKANEMATEIKCEIFNNWNQSQTIDKGCTVYDGISNDTIQKYITSSNNVGANSFLTPTPSFSPIYIIPDTLTEINCNYHLVKEQFYFDPGGIENNENDTLNYLTKFSNYLAYDDGTAEKVYGVLGSDAKIAYEFNLNADDTLKAIQIHFAHMNSDVSTKLFDLYVWSSLDIPNGVSDVQIQRETFLKPIYIDSINGFTTYSLDTLQALSAGTFYIGFKQLQSDYLNIGYDINNDSHTKLYYNTGLGWFQSIINGALMMRPLFGGCIPQGTFINDVSTQKIINYQLYPNPSSSSITLTTDEEIIHQIKIYDVIGKERLVIQNINHQFSNTINIESLESGIYFIKAINFTTGKTITSKFIKD